MTKASKLLFLGFVSTLFLPLLYAQNASNSPAGSNPAVTKAAVTGQAPDEMTNKITELVHTGKYSEAQQLTTGLLVAYPGDQRLVKAKALLEKLLTQSGSDSSAPSSQPTSSVPPKTTDPNAEQFTGMDRVEYNSLIELARQAQENTDLEQQKASLKQFMDESNAFLQKHPNQMLLWQLRAASALSLDDPYTGYDAGQKLLAAGAADSDSASLQQLLSRLKIKGWLDRAKMEELKKNTADSLVNSLGMKFAHISGTATLFSVWNTRVQDFQAFVNDTHYDATKGMSSGVNGHQGATFLASYVQAHYQQLGNSWQNPGWSQSPEDPVTGVSWEDAEAFARWLTAKERHIGKIRADQSYRLPTDAEWSMAVGSEGEKGETPKSKNGSVKKTISPLGNKVPNIYGIYDLGGSFFQFCEDWYDGAKVNKVARGGSWFHSDAKFRRVSSREEVGPSLRFNDFSFRVVLADSPKQ